MTDSERQTDIPGDMPEPDRPAGYLAGLGAEQAELLTRVNRVGLGKLRSYLGSGQAVAFLGAGSSARCTDCRRIDDRKVLYGSSSLTMPATSSGNVG
jgi:hypothetical protein